MESQTTVIIGPNKVLKKTQGFDNPSTQHTLAYRKNTVSPSTQTHKRSVTHIVVRNTRPRTVTNDTGYGKGELEQNNGRDKMNPE